mgnify:CR=1 FL=1
MNNTGFVYQVATPVGDSKIEQHHAHQIQGFFRTASQNPSLDRHLDDLKIKCTSNVTTDVDRYRSSKTTGVLQIFSM